MTSAKTPAEVAEKFGCTIEQAKAQIQYTIKTLEADLERAKASKTGKVRGLSVDWLENRLSAFRKAIA